MLLIVTRINGTKDAGILSIAYATSYLMLAIGIYGVRNFQITDSLKYYSFEDYRNMRWLSCSFMVVSSLVYCSWKHYEGDKAAIVLSVCLLKLVEAIEDLYHGEFQRNGRLDVAGFSGTIRILISYVVFIVTIVLTRNLFISISFFLILSFLSVIVSRILFSRLIVKGDRRREKRKIIDLLLSCFPLFIISFFNIYICNSPKYAIDVYLTESEQAYYAIISMPVFVINLLSGILYHPKLVYLAELWNKGNTEKFKKEFWKQIGSIVIIFTIILIAGATIGLKILEILYGVSLIALKYEFVILLLGGGMVAIYNFLTVCITIMRKQICLIWLSIFTMIVAYIISDAIVYHAGLLGASWLYSILMVIQMVVVCIVLFFYLKQ